MPEAPSLDLYPLEYRLRFVEEDGGLADVLGLDTLLDQSDALRTAQLYANGLGKHVEVWSVQRAVIRPDASYVGRRSPAI
jgi:hypothetical protein